MAGYNDDPKPETTIPHVEAVKPCHADLETDNPFKGSDEVMKPTKSPLKRTG
jgi:hypothetical protein